MMRVPVGFALQMGRYLWPEFIREHDCVFLARHAGTNPPPSNDTKTGWEAFVNHTHVFDEFESNAVTKTHSRVSDDLLEVEDFYDESSEDFKTACELGRMMAKLWALKLKETFPLERFRVYYTQYDNPIVRFHKVRDDESVWISDDARSAATDRSFEGMLIFDTTTMFAARAECGVTFLPM